MPHCPEQIGAQSLPLRLDLGLLLLFDMGSSALVTIETLNSVTNVNG